MRDIKYIIKRIIIGTGIALALMLIKQNVYAYEWETANDTQIPTSDYSVLVGKKTSRYWSTSAPTYPVNSTQGSDYFQLDSSAVDSGQYFTNVIPYYYNSINLTFSDITFQPDTYYKVIVPIRYNSSVFTSLSANVNEDKILSSSTYTTNNENWNIYSASLGFNIENDLDNNTNYPLYLYFSIIFSGSTSVSDLVIYINGNETISHSITAFNTISDSNYLLKTNQTCSSVSNRICTYYTRRIYKPFLYTTAVGEDYVIEDGNDIISNSSTDIKTQIGEIINGQFTEDLTFPYLNGGGKSFGENNYSLTDVIVMPLEFLRTIVTSSDTCTGPMIPLPGLNGTFTLPCVQSFATSILGLEFLELLKNIIGCLIGFKLITKMYNIIQRILDPTHLLWIDDLI